MWERKGLRALLFAVFLFICCISIEFPRIKVSLRNKGKMPRGQVEEVLLCLGFYSDPLVLLP